MFKFDPIVTPRSAFCSRAREPSNCWLPEYIGENRKTQGKQMFLLKQVKKDLKTHIQLMTNRIKMLGIKANSTAKLEQSQELRTHRALRVKAEHSHFLKEKQEIEETQRKAATTRRQQVKIQRELIKERMREVKAKTLLKNQTLRSQVRTQSASNKTYIEAEKQSDSALRRKNTQLIVSHERQLSNSRVLNVKSSAILLDVYYTRKIENEIASARLAQTKLQGLIGQEENLLDSLNIVLNNSLKHSNAPTPRALSHTQRIAFRDNN